MPTISSVNTIEQDMQPVGELNKEDPAMQETEFPANPTASLLIIMVGLPMSGKSQLARRILRRLNWLGNKTIVISSDDDDEHSIAQMVKARLQENFTVILDGCHSKKSTRKNLSDICKALGAKTLFVSCKCSDPALLDANMMEALNFRREIEKTTEEALGELRTSIENAEKQFEPITSSEGRFVQVFTTIQGPTVTAINVSGYREKEVLSVVSSRIPTRRTFYFSRHGESEFNVIGRIGGDSNLSERGLRYANLLAHYSTTAVYSPVKTVWTSRLKRTIHTARDVYAIGGHHRLAALDEIHAGVCEGLTYEEIQANYPEEFAMRDQDKLNYRYPHGESYTDLMTRVTPILEELETTTDVLVISHQAVLRVILGYFLDKDNNELPYQRVPLHTIIRVTNHGYSYNAEFVSLNVDCVDTNRKRPKNCSVNRTNDDALNTVPSHFDVKQQSWNGASQMV